MNDDPTFPNYLAQQSVQGDGVPEAAAAATSEGPFNPTGLLLLGGVFVFMYFFIIRPQRKEERRKKEMISKLAKGDKIVTTSGMIGFVHALKEDSLVLKLGETKIDFLPNAVSHIYEDPKNKLDAKASKTEKGKK